MKKLIILLAIAAMTASSSFAYYYQKALYNTGPGVHDFSTNLYLNAYQAYLTLYASRGQNNGGEDDYAYAALSSDGGYYYVAASGRYTYQAWQGNIYFVSKLDPVNVRVIAPELGDYARLTLSW